MPQKRTLRPGATTSRRVLLRAASSSSRLGRPDEIAARFLVRLNLDQSFLGGFFDQVGEGLEAVVGLGEARLATLECLLDHRAPDLLALAALGDERVQGLEENV